jgi:hypothetical protein
MQRAIDDAKRRRRDGGGNLVNGRHTELKPAPATVDMLNPKLRVADHASVRGPREGVQHRSFAGAIVASSASLMHATVRTACTTSRHMLRCG